MKKDERLGLPSASKVSRYFACEGSYRLEQGCAEFRTEEMILWAASGDKVHAFIAGEITADSLTEKEVDVATQCQEHEAKLLKDILSDPVWSVLREERLWLSGGLMSGKPDAVFRHHVEPIGFVVDYKSGYGVQDSADESQQIRTNIVLSAERFPEIETWYGAIIAPLTVQDPQLVKYSRDDVAKSRLALLALLKRITKPDAPINAGVHCRWCPAVLKCEAALAMLQSFGLMDAGSAEGQTLSKYLVLAKSAKPIIDRLEKQAKKLLNEGTAVPGWQLGRPGSTRVISDPFAAFKLLEKAELVDRDTFMKECISVSIGDLEATVKKNKGMTGKAAKDAVNAKLISVIEFKPKEPSLEQV